MGKRRLRGIIERIEPISGSGPRKVKDDFGGPDIEVKGTEIAPSKPAHVRKAELDAIRDHNRRQILQLLPQHVVPEYAKAAPKMIAPHKPGMRPIATLAGNAIYIPNKPWRRF